MLQTDARRLVTAIIACVRAASIRRRQAMNGGHIALCVRVELAVDRFGLFSLKRIRHATQFDRLQKAALGDSRLVFVSG